MSILQAVTVKESELYLGKGRILAVSGVIEVLWWKPINPAWATNA